MAKTYLGIEIGKSTIKFVLCTKGQVEGFFIESFPEDFVKEGCIVNWDGMAKFLKQMLKKHKISCKNVALVLPESVTYIRRLLLPYMTVEQLKVNLPYEFHDFISEQKEDYIYDYALMELLEKEEETQNPSYMDLMAAAVAKETIEQYRKMLKVSGLKLKIAAPPSCAYQNIVFHHMVEYSSEKKMDYAILDIGYETVELRIFTEGKYETEKSIENGLKEIQELLLEQVHMEFMEFLKIPNHQQILSEEKYMTIYETIALEVMRVVNFFTYNHPNNTLEHLYCCGGGAFLEPLLDVLQDTVGLKIKKVSELFPNQKEDQLALVMAPAAVGITWN